MHQNKSRLQTAIWAMELIFISGGLISIVVMVKKAVFFCSFDAVLCCIKGLTSSLRGWLSSPLYICVVINLMIFLIAATSRFQHHDMDSRHHEAADEKDESFFHATFSTSSSRSPKPPPRTAQGNEKTHPQAAINREACAGPIYNIGITCRSGILGSKHGTAPAPSTKKTLAATTCFSETHQSHLSWKDTDQEEKHNQRVKDSLLAVFDGLDLAKTSKIIKKTYPLESSKDIVEFNQDTICRIVNKTDHGEEATTAADKEQIQPMEEEQEALRNEQDSMEAMWKAINNQLKKSEIWPLDQSRLFSMQSIDSKGLLPSVATMWKELKKSVTFIDAISMRKRGGLMRDPSMSLEDFNQRVEGFINKFNNGLRIERQESEQRFLDMINHGF